MRMNKKSLLNIVLAFALAIAMAAGAIAAEKTTQTALMETPGLLLANSLGLDQGVEVISLSSGMDEKGRAITFVLYADATPVFGADTGSPIYKENIGIAAISASGKITKEDKIIEGGYTPSMANIGLDGEGELGVYLLVSAPTGGSGGTSTFKMMRYYNGAWSELLGEEFSLPITGALNNYFRGTVRIPDAKLHFLYGLSVGEKETLVKSGNYEADGNLIKRDDNYFWTDGFVTVTPMYSGGDMVLIAQEVVYAGYHANPIAQINATYRLNGEGTGLELQRTTVQNMEEKVLASTK